MYAGVAVALIGAFITAQSRNPFFLAVAILGFALFAASTLYQFYGIRCLRCFGRIGHTLSYSDPFSLPSGYSFCPFCGISLDTDIDATPGA